MAIRSWTSAQYLGHTNLKHSLDAIKQSIENVAITSPNFILYPTTVTDGTGLGGYLRVQQTFLYRIGDTTYLKGVGITQAANTGDATCSLLPHSSTDNTASGGYDVTASRYRAGVLLIDADGTFSTIIAETEGSNVWGVTAGSRLAAIGYLVEDLAYADIEDKAIVAFFVIGDGTNAFTSTSTLTISTNLDFYEAGGMVLASGVSTDGGQMLGLL